MLKNNFNDLLSFMVVARERSFTRAYSAAKFFAPKRIKLCTAANERKTAIAHGAN